MCMKLKNAAETTKEYSIYMYKLIILTYIPAGLCSFWCPTTTASRLASHLHLGMNDTTGRWKVLIDPQHLN